MNERTDAAASRYRLDDLALDLRRRSVHRGDSEIALPRRSFELLAALARAAPAPMSTDELIDAVWDGRVVEAATVAKRVELLRQSLGDDSKAPRYIALERGYGYRLIPVPAPEPEPESESESAADVPSARPAAPASHGRAVLAAFAAVLAAAIALVQIVRDPAPAAPPDTIAVLPFQSLSPDEDDALLASGLTEELRHELSRDGDLRVAGRTSSDYFKDDRGDLRAVGEALGVASLVDGSVRRSGDTVRITAQLVSVADGFQLWSQTYDREVRDILEIQRDIARSVAAQLRGIPPPAPSSSVDDPLPDPEAYAMYLQGASLSQYRGKVGDLAQAQALIEQVLERNPDYAPAWVQLGVIHGRRILARDPTYPLPPEQGFAIALDATRRALALDPESAEAHASLAGAAWVFEGDAAKAAPLVERALALEPWNLDLLTFAADFAKSIGRGDTALQLEERIVARDALCVRCRVRLAQSYLHARRFADAEREYRTLRATEGKGYLWSIGVALLLQGKATDALASFEAMDDKGYLGYLQLQGRVMALNDLGRSDEAEAALDALVDSWGNGKPLVVAETLAYMGRVDPAFDWMERALPEYSALLRTEYRKPFYAPLHDDPRWQELLNRLGLAPEQVARIPLRLERVLAPAP